MQPQKIETFLKDNSVDMLHDTSESQTNKGLCNPAAICTQEFLCRLKPKQNPMPNRNWEKPEVYPDSTSFKSSLMT